MRGTHILPTALDADPNVPGVEEAADRLEEVASLYAVEPDYPDTGNLAVGMDRDELARIGSECCTDYETDKADRKEWERVAERALKAAAQSGERVEKDTPWKGAANVKWPLLTEAMLQFNARMYPAVIKGDEAVLAKVIGRDIGRPQMQMTPSGPQPVVLPGPDGQPVPQWQVAPGAKGKRALRVAEYLNTVLFYRDTDWESDTDMLLMQIPAVGCAFRKRWWDNGPKSSLISALRVYLPKGAKSVETSPRITEEVHDVFPHEYSRRVRSGHYLDWDDLYAGDKPAPRMFLEQHRLIDLDDDGVVEPYIVTLDHESRRVLRIEAAYSEDDVEVRNGRIIAIRRQQFYTKYELLPDPEGGVYGLGLGHLLDQLSEVVNTAINQILDAGSAQTAGGGFIASGVRLQEGRGSKSVIRFAPGEYKTVPVTGEALRNGIVERTLPQVSAVTFQVLDLILGAAKSISGAKDVMTGEASNNGQVGTTLALIEQGLQVFNATAKRVFRSLKAEYTLLRDQIRRYGDNATAEDYDLVLDDPEANFFADFASEDMDIRPVSDPSSVTRMQRMARSQYLMSMVPMIQAVGGDVREVMRRAFEAADVEDIDKLLPEPQPPQPDPKAEAEAMSKQADAQAKVAKAHRDMAEVDKTQVETAGMMMEAERRKFELQRQAMNEGLNAALAG